MRDDPAPLATGGPQVAARALSLRPPVGQGRALTLRRGVAGSRGLDVAILWPDGGPAGALSIAADNRMTTARQAVPVAALHRKAGPIARRLADLERKFR